MIRDEEDNDCDNSKHFRETLQQYINRFHFDKKQEVVHLESKSKRKTV